ncbi:MAG: GbsR/MarR family transcriptional regulator [Steroidobacteraceae bacterium]
MTGKNMHFDRFIEQLGRLAEGEGLPRTAGRMMGVLMIAGAPRSIADLAARLKVSRASISTNSRLLQSLAIADLISEPGSRRDYLQISGDPCGSLLTLGLGRMQSMCTAVRQMRLAMNGAHLGAPRTRLKRIERLYVLAITQAQAVLETWRDSHTGRQNTVANRSTPRLLPQPGHQPVRKKRSRVHRANVRE